MDLLDHLLRLKAVDSRLSPLGVPEYRVPEGSLKRANAITRMRDKAVSYYSGDAYENDAVRRHEQIHQGQAKLRKLDPAATVDIFRRLSPFFRTINSRIGDVTDESRAIEQPAYNLSDSAEDFRVPESLQRRMVSEYLNLLKSENAGDEGILGIETTIPEKILREYIKSTPQPIRRPLPKELR